MAKFYFTYGLEDQPFIGGWTEIEAPSREAACDCFRIIHPNKQGSRLINCSCIYAEEQFKKTAMFSFGNFGKKCHERITLTVERIVK